MKKAIVVLVALGLVFVWSSATAMEPTYQVVCQIHWDDGNFGGGAVA